jgi:hypothetical protein
MQQLVGVGADVMAPHPNGGRPVLKTARILLIMPELAIVEYYEDGMRHCLPKNQLRAPFKAQDVSHALVSK